MLPQALGETMRNVIEHTFADRNERMGVLRGGDVKRYLGMLESEKQEGEEVALAVMCRAVRSGCVLMRFDGSPLVWYYVHKSAKYHGCLQLTTWDEEGPVGDMRVTEPSDFAYLMSGTLTASIE